jgi:integrase
MIEGIDVRIRYAKEAGIPDAVVMELVGHESAAMSQRYTHVARKPSPKPRSRCPKSENIAFSY